jgi:hypothetical protein
LEFICKPGRLFHLIDMGGDDDDGDEFEPDPTPSPETEEAS